MQRIKKFECKEHTVMEIVRIHRKINVHQVRNASQTHIQKHLVSIKCKSQRSMSHHRKTGRTPCVHGRTPKIWEKPSAPTPSFYSTRTSISRVSAKGTWTHAMRPSDALFQQHIVYAKFRSWCLVFCLGKTGRWVCVLGLTHRGLSGRYESLNEKGPVLSMILLLFSLMLLAVLR